jgi:hypothetical protein
MPGSELPYASELVKSDVFTTGPACCHHIGAGYERVNGSEPLDDRGVSDV